MCVTNSAKGCPLHQLWCHQVVKTGYYPFSIYSFLWHKNDQTIRRHSTNVLLVWCAYVQQNEKVMWHVKTQQDKPHQRETSALLEEFLNTVICADTFRTMTHLVSGHRWASAGLVFSVCPWLWSAAFHRTYSTSDRRERPLAQTKASTQSGLIFSPFFCLNNLIWKYREFQFLASTITCWCRVVFTNAAAIQTWTFLLPAVRVLCLSATLWDDAAGSFCLHVFL